MRHIHFRFDFFPHYHLVTAAVVATVVVVVVVVVLVNDSN